MALCQFANILEEAIESIYNKRTDSLRQLYGKAEKLYGHVRQYGEKWGLGTAASVQRVDAWNPETSLLLHNGTSNFRPSVTFKLLLIPRIQVYFHVVLLIFRPFLIAEAALQSGEGSGGIGDIWLRQACRHATDAAQDALAFTWNMLRGPEECNVSRGRVVAAEKRANLSFLRHGDTTHSSSSPHVLFCCTTACAIRQSIPTTWSSFRWQYLACAL